LVAELCIARSQKNKIRKQAALLESDIDETPYHRLKALTEAEQRVDQLVKREERLTRLLQIHPEATVGKARDQVKKNTAAREARDTLEGHDDLIAAPVH
jgi:hypothetical protein